MSEFWCVHRASGAGGTSLRASSKGRHDDALPPECSTVFAYIVTQERELLPHDRVMTAIREGTHRPRLIKVALRRTLAEATRVARRWAQ